MNTAKYVLKRVLFMLLTFFIIISACFILIRLLPNETATMFGKDMQLVLQSRYRQGLTDINGNPIPLMEQYINFVKNTLIGGNWGTSEKLYFGQDCFQVFLSKLPSTVLVNLYSLLFSIPIGIMLGIYAAIKKNRWQDQLISTSVMIFVSVPSYVYAFLVQYFLYFKLGWLPLNVYSLAEAGGSWFTPKMFHSMIAPILALSFGTIAGLVRFTRAELTETLTSDYMLLARTKGLTRAQATSRHALKNAMVPILPTIISSFVGILGGSLVIEKIFSIPGVGGLYMQSVFQRDYDVFMIDTIFYTLIGLLAGILVDISYGFIDPRIRMGEK